MSFVAGKRFGDRVAKAVHYVSQVDRRLNPFVRQAAAKALSELRDREATKQRIAALEEIEDVNQIIAAIRDKESALLEASRQGNLSEEELQQLTRERLELEAELAKRQQKRSQDYQQELQQQAQAEKDAAEAAKEAEDARIDAIYAKIAAEKELREERKLAHLEYLNQLDEQAGKISDVDPELVNDLTNQDPQAVARRAAEQARQAAQAKFNQENSGRIDRAETSGDRRELSRINRERDKAGGKAFADLIKQSRRQGLTEEQTAAATESLVVEQLKSVEATGRASEANLKALARAADLQIETQVAQRSLEEEVNEIRDQLERASERTRSRPRTRRR